MDHAQKIAVWLKYGLDEADIVHCYHALGTRLKPLTLEEGQILDLKTVLKVAALRDRVQQGVLNYVREPPPAGDGLTAERVRDPICRASLLEFAKS